MCIFDNPRAMSMRRSQIATWRHIPRANLQRNEPGDERELARLRLSLSKVVSGVHVNRAL
jgi:hypothetical protein